MPAVLNAARWWCKLSEIFRERNGFVPKIMIVLGNKDGIAFQVLRDKRCDFKTVIVVVAMAAYPIIATVLIHKISVVTYLLFIVSTCGVRNLFRKLFVPKILVQREDFFHPHVVNKGVGSGRISSELPYALPFQVLGFVADNNVTDLLLSNSEAHCVRC
jgi:hypothetical protein